MGRQSLSWPQEGGAMSPPRRTEAQGGEESVYKKDSALPSVLVFPVHETEE